MPSRSNTRTTRYRVTVEEFVEWSEWPTAEEVKAWEEAPQAKGTEATPKPTQQDKSAWQERDVVQTFDSPTFAGALSAIARRYAGDA